MAYINLYNGNPTAGLADGTLVSTAGAQTNPVAFTLDASQSESATAKLALRCESGYHTTGNTVISFVGTNEELGYVEVGTCTNTVIIR